MYARNFLLNDIKIPKIVAYAILISPASYS